MERAAPRSSRPASDVAILSVTLDRESAEPLVRQLCRHLRTLIFSRQLPPHTRLPSTRLLSRDLEVSRTVVLEAFAQLSAEGLLESRTGSGHFVTDLPPKQPRGERAPGTAEDEDIATTIYQPAGAPFDPAWQAVDLFPVHIWAKMLVRGWRRHHEAGLERHWAGLPALREAVADHLQGLRGFRFDPDDIFITAGHRDLLTLLARSLRGSAGKPRAWIEDPGLGSARDALIGEGFQPVPVPVDSEGLDVAMAERLAPEALLAVVTPARQFPLGVQLSLARRLALLAWAKRRGAVIVDDDYDGEIRFSGRSVPPLARLDPAAAVLTTGSFSKLTFPGLRLGYAAGPRDLIQRLVHARRERYTLPPTSTQAALAELIASGAFAQHLRRLRSTLTRRRRVLHRLLSDHGVGLLEILPQQAGMQIAVALSPQLAAKARDVEIAMEAKAAGLVLLPLSEQYAAAAPRQGFVLGYAGWSEERIIRAAELLVGLLTRYTES